MSEQNITKRFDELLKYISNLKGIVREEYSHLHHTASGLKQDCLYEMSARKTQNDAAISALKGFLVALMEGGIDEAIIEAQRVIRQAEAKK